MVFRPASLGTLAEESACKDKIVLGSLFLGQDRKQEEWGMCT